ncbi:DNA replication and repair protein RecN [Nitrosomonas sp. PY1]|uniref:DNA repair protein RecN n=1 Tax=Nitrosomonas sp. PY1 TaxID=1803906 RepID=UPI001FC89C05|nr:DNA repair protein RecN [Nitrosomonas sp. PY1]GKS70132.1 DNA replication and repair protein RecN [Nitrosomonas sp. PY1]
MLKHLSIRDFVIVDHIELEFLSGFTVLTGETGAGKSILMDALMLALGERSDIQQIRPGCERSEINAVFDIQSQQNLIDWLNGNDLQGDPGVCLMRRIIDINGRSRNYINGHNVTQQQLRIAGSFLVAIHSQHAHQSLLHRDAQRELLDAYAQCEDLLSTVRDTYQNWQTILQQRISAEQSLIESQAKREQIEWQLQELSELNLTAEEWQNLQSDHARLSHAAALLSAAENGIEQLSENEHAAFSQINAVCSQLRQLLEHDSQLNEIVDLLDSTTIQLQESIYALNDYRQSLDLDPQLLLNAEQRLSTIHNLARKFRLPPEELLQFQTTLKEQLETLEAGSNIEKLKTSEAEAQSIYLQQAKMLSIVRAKAAESLSNNVTTAMQTLAMNGGQFTVVLTPLQAGNSTGLEQIEFHIAAHKGMPPQPLSKVASGGELSRISLALQVIASKAIKIPTLIFDEVDVGIGGKVAEIVGNLLKKLGQKRQVLCITHLPQVAAAGDQQWQVIKVQGPGKNQPILSEISSLDQQQRIEEIARMLGGITITETTRQHATEMLRNGSSIKIKHS